ncbi:MAG: malto-oligosyltrehalose synthase [Candidatus Latescibacterota bacterium]|nr:MAG: malto-oligosyltrehalose synthase [Candidatus Latescibacterota bacterium]
MLRVPRATYRLQFNPRFRFQDAARIVPYLQALGVSDVYASPVFKARRGSAHGYDITDHTQLNPDLGKMVDFEHFASELRKREMGLILDVVPNHMGVADDSNRYWQDVLENGPSSPFAKFFDIDWSPPKPDLANKVLLPFLGDQFGRVLENGELRLTYARGAFWIKVYDRRLPVAPRTWTRVLEPLLALLRTTHARDDGEILELESILTALRHLPARTESEPARVEERRREKEVIKRRLGTLMNSAPAFRRALEQVVTRTNGRRGEPRSFDALEELLAEQAYRLSYWRVASDEINYRRFFDINELAAIRVEELDVFKLVHRFVLRMLSQGWVTGLRIDHPDGLFDPEQYFRDIQQACGKAMARAARRAEPRVEVPKRAAGATRVVHDRDRPCFVVAEKILSGDEKLDPHWAVHGTTGYETMNHLNGVFVDRDNSHTMRAIYQRFTGEVERYEDTIYASKKLVLNATMSGELGVLARHLDRLSEQHRWSRDFTLPSLRNALREVIACFPVYRTYIRADSQMVSDEARRSIETAIRTAQRRNPVMNPSLFEFIRSVLLLEDPPELTEAERAARRNFVLRFQQLTAPVTAKGVEDTAFYRTLALVSLNEVGGEPNRFGVPVDEFHGANAERCTNWPFSISASSTHDTKRGEDVRARINVLSEIPQEWEAAIQRWRDWNRNKKSILDGVEVPDANEEYHFYQTLVGVWPLQVEDAEAEHATLVTRLEVYMQKAIKEAKLHTSWVNPNETYENAVIEFVRNTLAMESGNEFLRDVMRFSDRIAPAGALNSLAQTVLKVASPGIPDFYQGTETWSFALVDPDNRRAVEFERLAQQLAELERQEKRDAVGCVRELLDSWRDGRVKMYVTRKALGLRRDHAALFENGDYVPLEARGSGRGNVCAFARQHADRWVLAAVPRLTCRLQENGSRPLGEPQWEDTALLLPRPAPDEWVNVLTGETHSTQRDEWETTLSLASVFASFPVTLLRGHAS